MKLFYSYMWHLFAHIPTLSRVIQILLKIFSPANQWHRLVMPGRYSLIILCFTVFSLNEARPQSPVKSGTVSGSDIKSLTIGDTIPEELWHVPLQVVNHPSGKNTITLNDYRGRLIILDFWATWCSSCIKNFSKIDSLNSALQPDMQIVLVNSIDGTGDSKNKIEACLKNLDFQISLPSVVNDTIFKKVFPRKLIPHYAWIDGKGKVRAITSSKELTTVNIKNILQDSKASLKKKDY